MHNSSQAITEPDGHHPDRLPPGLLAALGVLIVALVLLLWAGLNSGYRTLQSEAAMAPPGQPPSVTLFRLIIDGHAPLLLDEANTEAFLLAAQGRSGALQEAARQHLAVWQAEQSAAFMQQAEAPVDHYLDWYYSLSGSYLRLFMAATGELETLLLERMERLLFDQGGLDRALTEFITQSQHHYLDELERFMQHQQNDLLGELVADFRRREVQLTTTGIPATPAIVELDIGTPLHGLFRPTREYLDTQLPAAAYGLVAAPAIALAARSGLLARMSTTPAARAATAATRRYISRLPAQLAARALSGAQASAATAPSGPVALVIGAGVFAGSIGVDWALLKAEEASQREAQKQQLLQVIATTLQQQADTLDAQLQTVFHLQQQGLQAARPQGGDKFRIF